MLQAHSVFTVVDGIRVDALNHGGSSEARKIFTAIYNT